VNIDPRCKQPLYFKGSELAEIREEAERQGRSLSWIVRQAWLIAHEKLTRLPDAPTDPDGRSGRRSLP
jgi:uncharacterized small protein (TIGR04563 family)